jgi:hypothetical protein
LNSGRVRRNRPLRPKPNRTKPCANMRLKCTIPKPVGVKVPVTVPVAVAAESVAAVRCSDRSTRSSSHPGRPCPRPCLPEEHAVRARELDHLRTVLGRDRPGEGRRRRDQAPRCSIACPPPPSESLDRHHRCRQLTSRAGYRVLHRGDARQHHPAVLRGHVARREADRTTATGRPRLAVLARSAMLKSLSIVTRRPRAKVGRELDRT